VDTDFLSIRQFKIFTKVMIDRCSAAPTVWPRGVPSLGLTSVTAPSMQSLPLRVIVSIGAVGARLADPPVDDGRAARSSAMRAAQFPGRQQIFGFVEREPLFAHRARDAVGPRQPEAVAGPLERELEALRKRAQIGLSRGLGVRRHAAAR
jgi:hypothetical protein